MTWTRFSAMAAAALAFAGAARAGQVPATAARELQAAAQQLEEAARLGSVANDPTEAGHLLAARDLLREAEPQLEWGQRLQAKMLEQDIGRDVVVSVDIGPPPPFLSLPSSAATRVERDDLGELARRGRDLARQTDAPRAATPAPGA